MRNDASNNVEKYHVSTYFIVGTVVFMLLGSVLLGILLTKQSSDALKEQIREHMLDVSKTAAAMIDGDVMKTLDAEDYATDEYKSIYKILREFQSSVELEFIYGIRVGDDGTFTFTIDPAFSDSAVFGEEVKITDALINASEGIASVDEEPYEDRWGRFYSAYSPIFDSEGNVSDIIGVDFAAEWFEDKIAQQRFTTIAVGAFYLIVGLLIALVITNRVRKHFAILTQEAERASNAKSHFLANMSHEIRTPINAVLGMNEMILRESDDQAVLSYAENIRLAGHTLLGLINDILDFSKIEEGKLEIIDVEYDLASVVNDLVNMVELRAEKKDIIVEVNIDEKTPNFLYGDEVRIKQVITNLLTNAVKYTEKGKVTFRVGYEVTPDDSEAIFLNVAVSDTGIGIKPEDVKKLFSEFERIEEKRNRNIEGTGLGLTITKDLLTLMGSRLKVESVYGEGSTFSFKLRQDVVEWDPIGSYEEAYKASVVSKKKYKEKFVAPDAKVLVVDDVQMNLAVFASLLKCTDVQIETAESGDECLSLTQTSTYDIIFLDHMMPKKDGVETLHELKADKTNKNLKTPVVCLTANAISGARENYLAQGFDDYLTKPIDAEMLEEMMIKYLPPEKIKPAGEGGAANANNASDSKEGSAALPAWLFDIEEIDAEKGLSHCGAEDAYLDTLKIYGSNATASANEIDSLWASGDLANTTVKVHAVKSLSRAIGAEGIGSLAEKLELAGKAGNAETVGAEVGTLTDRIRALCEKLAPLCADDKQTSGAEDLPPVAPEELADAYEALGAAIENMSAKDAKYILDFLAGYSLPEEDSKRISEIRKNIDSFEWDEAGKLLKG